MKIDKRVERNTISVKALQSMLKAVIKTPGEYLDNESLRHALISQGALAKFSEESKSISPSSINTLKRTSENCLQGGFDTLDRLRVCALESLEIEKSKVKQPNKITKNHLRTKIIELELENLQLKEYLHQLTYALQKSLCNGVVYAEKSRDLAVIALCQKEQSQLRNSLSLIKLPLNINVIKLHER